MKPPKRNDNGNIYLKNIEMNDVLNERQTQMRSRRRKKNKNEIKSIAEIIYKAKLLSKLVAFKVNELLFFLNKL